MPPSKRRFYNADHEWEEAPMPDYEDESAAPGPGRIERELAERRADGAKLEPVLPSASRSLSETFWGQAWNRNLQTYADQVSSLTKGRTEFRKGRVLDLAVLSGEMTAVVAGNRLWDVKILAQKLDPESWAELRQDCVGQITDVSDLLAGEVPPAVLTRLAQPEIGLFPSASHLRCHCRCPDHASMCLHAAAVLYAFGTQLDANPSHLFTLRGGAPQDLLAKLDEVLADLTVGPTQDAARAAAIGGQDLSTLFGVDIEDGSD